jgi:glycosyltransferase involved in cell wall biosynthesis
MLANDVLVLGKKMKIVYLIPCCGVSGGIAVVCQHANRLLARGHEVLLVTETTERSIDWFPGQRAPIVGLDEYPEDVDILVATGWSTSFRVAALPARQKFYFVQSDETRFHPRNSPWEHITRLSYTVGYNYLTEARWIKAWLADHFGQDAELVPNGLDDTIFFPSEPIEPKGKKPRILLEGAIGLPYKGMAEAFAAVQDLDVEVWCVSSYGKPEKHWKCDRFFEHVPMTEMRRIYSSCDILLKLSRVEGFFGPPMEMMACGGVAVVGKVTGHDEYIENEVNALVVDPFQPAQAARAISRLIDDHSLRAQLIEGGRQTAQRWQWEPSIDVLERYYLDVLDGRRGTAMTMGKAAVADSVAYLYRQLRGEERFYVLPTPESGTVVAENLKRIDDIKGPRIANPTISIAAIGRKLWELLKSPNRVKRAGSLLFPFIVRAIRNPRHGIRSGKIALSVIRTSGWHGLKLAMISQNEQRQLRERMRREHEG